MYQIWRFRFIDCLGESYNDVKIHRIGEKELSPILSDIANAKLPTLAFIKRE